MASKYAVRQAYRLYAVVIAILTTFSLLWYEGLVQIEHTGIGVGWGAVSVGGLAIIAAMYRNRQRVFDGNRSAQRRFDASSLTTLLLSVYAGALVILSALTLAWYGSQGGLVGTSVLGYSWIGVSGVGTVLLIGLVVSHIEMVVAELTSEITPENVF